MSIRILFVFCLTLIASCSGPEHAGDFRAEDVALDVPGGAAAYVPVLEGPLRVLSATPAGPMASLAPGQQITVTFSRPMVPLGEAPEVAPGTIRLQPDVEGRLFWEGTQTLVFRPSEPLPPATRYRAELAAGLTSLDGEALADAFTWTFETPRPVLLRSEPAYGEPFADPAAAFILAFNQRITASAAARYVALFDAEGRPRRLEVAVQNRGDSTLVVRPDRPLGRGRPYELRLLPGLPSAQGALGMADTTVVSFRTYGAPVLVEAVQPAVWWEPVRPDVDPARGVTLVFSTPVRFGDLRRALAFTPAVELPAGIEARDDDVGTEHTIPGPWAPETRYRVAVRDLVDVFGQTLAEGRAAFTTRAFEPALRVATGVLVIEAEQRAAIPLYATNIDRVRAGFTTVDAEHVVPMARRYDWEHHYGPDAEAGEAASPLPEPVALNRTIALGVPRNRPSYSGLRIDSLLRGGTGIVAFRMTTNALPGAEQREWRGIAQVTRLGLTAKFGAHQNLVLVTDLQDARPVPGARVTIRDIDNRVRWQGTTDAQGRVVTPGWDRLGIEPPGPWDRPVQFAIVEKDGDVAFTSSAYMDGLEPYRFELDFAWQPDPRVEAASIFTDRGLYRAGETVHVKGILRHRTDGAWSPITDSVRVLVDSPRGRRVYDRRHLPGDLGTFDLVWPVPAAADQGDYTVRVAYAADTAAARREPWEPGDIGSGHFRVDAFRTATFAVTGRSSADAYVAGDFFEGALEGRYLFGAPMGGQPARFELLRTPGTYTPPGYEGYRFGSARPDDGVLDQVLVQADTVLGPDGLARTRIPLPGNAHGTPATLVWSGAVTDPARQEIGMRRELTLHPGLFYIGLRPRSTFLDLSREQTMQVDVVTVDPGGVPVSGKPVVVELVREHWNSVRETGTDGRLRWRSERTEEVLGQSTIETRPGRAKRLQLPIAEGGSYLIRATSHDVRGNVVRSETYFYATGSGYVAWQRDDDDRIDLVADRTTYRPGETARLMVQSPYESATALVTVEREGILSSRVETLTGSAPQIEIPLTDAHLPNVFVSVILLHGRTATPGAGPDAGAPGFKIGYARLRVDPGQHHLQVEVRPDRETYRPGDEVRVELQLRDAGGRGVPGEIAFSAADAGVLNLIGYRLPDPFETFHGPRPLGLTTSESRANLVEQRNFGQKTENPGGGGGDPDFLLRRDFRPLAHWAPALRTDAQGRATVSFRLPESLTTFRLMATALTARNDFGAGSVDIVVAQPLVLQAALPRFARLDDRFEAGVLVTNTTGVDGEVSVTARADGLTLDDPSVRRVFLRDGATEEVRFAWTAAQTGRATLRFEAALSAERDALETTLTVAAPMSRQTTATFAATDGTAGEALRLPPDRVPGLGGLDVRLSSTALVGLEGAARYLFTYPYGCLEQKTSGVRPLLAADALLETFDLDVLGGNRREVIERWLRDASTHWTGQGFSMWPGQYIEQPFVSAYVVLALAEAAGAGFAPPADLVQPAVERLADQVRNRSERPGFFTPAVWADTRALMLYALVRHGQVLESELSTLAADVERGTARLSADGESYLLRALVRAKRPALERYRSPLVERIRRRIRVEATTAYIEAPSDAAYGWIFAGTTRSTAFGLTALLEAGTGEDLRPVAQRMVRYLMQSRTTDHWASTQDNAAVVEAFQAYHAAYEQADPSFTAEVRVAGRRVLSEAFRGRSLRQAETHHPADALPAGERVPIDIAKNGPGTLYYTLRLETFSTAPQAAAAHGLSVERRIQRLDATGRPLAEAQRTGDRTVTIAPGDLVRVTLRISSPVDRHYVVVDDALPAGLEALNAAFATTDQRVLEAAGAGSDRWWGSFNHTELRDDRVLLFADLLQRGEHTYTYVARATTPGTFVHPPARAEMMYQPDTNGRNASGVLVVAPPASSARR